ncbi:alternative ribosome-rescue factor A [Ursidibacter arcticus]
MKNSQKHLKQNAQHIEYALQRGEIKESAVKALVTDKLFRTRVERNRKGKGSYQRNAKHRHKLTAYGKSESPFKSNIIFEWAFNLHYVQNFIAK